MLILKLIVRSSISKQFVAFLADLFLLTSFISKFEKLMNATEAQIRFLNIKLNTYTSFKSLLNHFIVSISHTVSLWFYSLVNLQLCMHRNMAACIVDLRAYIWMFWIFEFLILSQFIQNTMELTTQHTKERKNAHETMRKITQI